MKELTGKHLSASVVKAAFLSSTHVFKEGSGASKIQVELLTAEP